MNVSKIEQKNIFAGLDYQCLPTRLIIVRFYASSNCIWANTRSDFNSFENELFTLTKVINVSKSNYIYFQN